MKILSIDVGGTNVKMLATGHHEPRKSPSGDTLTPMKMVEAVRELTGDWEYEAVSIGLPVPCGHGGPKCEPGNLGCGWVGFDFAAAFERPVKISNDAAMQALGSYDGGRMLFLGLGTGLGAALIAENVILPLELGHLSWCGARSTLGDILGRRGLARLGARKWRRRVSIAIERLMQAFLADYVVVGGGNAKKLKQLPLGSRLGHNLTAFRGGFRLWGVDDIPVLTADEPHAAPPAPPALDWRLI